MGSSLCIERGSGVEQQLNDLKGEIKDLKAIIVANQRDGEVTIARPRVCSKMFIGPEDLRAYVSQCSRIHVDFLPGNELKLPRFIEVKSIPVEEAIGHVCLSGQTRLNLAAVFARFVEQPGMGLQRWIPLKGLISWSALQGRFEYILEHFVRHLPCGADKTISQVLTAIFERGRRGSTSTEYTKEDGDYLLGVCRHTSTTPFMPVALWTHAAVFNFSHGVEGNASRWMQGLLSDSSLRVTGGSFRGECLPQPVTPAPEVVKSDRCIDIAIAAGGGSDVVTATTWLAHIGAPSGSIVFQPGRGKPRDYSMGQREVLVEVKDFVEPLSAGKQFYEGTALAGRTQHLAKALGLDYRYFFLLQDKNLLSSGATKEVLDHMNDLAGGIHKAVSKFARCAKIHLVDTGGDVLHAVLTSAGCGGPGLEKQPSSNSADSVEPRKERDVWSLLLAMALQERFECEMQLVVMAPGVDGQSIWLGASPQETAMNGR